MEDRIPSDILFSILVRLHLKSLLRFQSVSKSWKSMICEKGFKKTHHHLSKSWSPKKLLLVQTNDGVFEFRDFENPQIAMRKQNFPLKRFQQVPALCSCDGLVLLKSHLAYKSFALWNPYTNEYGIYECPYVKAYSCTTPHACGFCYDPIVDDYKIIFIYKSFYVVCYVSKNFWLKKTSVHSKVEGLGARSWECSQGIIVEDRVFWSLDWKINHLVRRDSTIIYFDVKSDEVKELPKPDFTEEYDKLYGLTCLKGCVCLYGGKIYSKSFEVRIMKEDGWKLLMNINCNVFSEQFVERSVILGSTNQGEIVFQVGRGLQLIVIYDPEQHRFVKKIPISKDLKHFAVPLCLESLYFPEPRSIMGKRKLQIRE